MEDTLPNAQDEQFQFTIPALQERRTRTLKHGDTFAMFDDNGDVLSLARQPRRDISSRHAASVASEFVDLRPAADPAELDIARRQWAR